MTNQSIPAAISDLAEAVQYLIDNFSIVTIGGEVRFSPKSDIEEMRGDEFHNRPVSLYSQSNTKLLMRRALAKQGVGARDADSAMAIFLVDQKTVVYNNIGFYPPGSAMPSNTLNLYRPPRVCGQPGTESQAIMRFIFEVICDRSNVLYRYLMQWLAHAIKKPFQKPGVMIVLIGEQGVGKGSFMDLVQRIWGSSAWRTSSIAHVVGRFNAALEGVQIVQLDEALFEGDKSSQDAMKSLITEPMISIEQKNQPIRQTHSFHRFMAATNHSVFSRIEKSDRRHAYFRISSRYKGNGKYFAKLREKIEDDVEVAKFVNQLYETDITDFVPGVAPKSRLRDEQVVDSLEGFEAFWYQCLLDSFNEITKLYEISSEFRWTESVGGFVSTNALRLAYNNWLTGHRRFKHLNYRDIQLHILKFVGDCKGRGKSRGYNLPGLEHLRKKFEVALELNKPLDWCD